MVAELADKAKSIVRELDPTNCLKFFWLKSSTHEVLVALRIISRFLCFNIMWNRSKIEIMQCSDIGLKYDMILTILFQIRADKINF